MTDGAGRCFSGAGHAGAAGRKPSVNNAPLLIFSAVPIHFLFLKFSPIARPPFAKTGADSAISGWKAILAGTTRQHTRMNGPTAQRAIRTRPARRNCGRGMTAADAGARFTMMRGTPGITIMRRGPSPHADVCGRCRQIHQIDTAGIQARNRMMHPGFWPEPPAGCCHTWKAEIDTKRVNGEEGHAVESSPHETGGGG